ncbi:MAG: guanosine monophosphate reductase [Candidatus Moranbacteria bacterium]|nr:guanosine monophosphate reductase [Candidatus Moranbacteria bacterium]
METTKIKGIALTFDDVNLIPGIARVPAHQVKLEVNLTKKIKLKIPILSAAMDTVTQAELAAELAKLGGLGVLHRNCTIEEQAQMVAQVKKQDLKVAAAIGTSQDFLKRTQALVKQGVDLICIDLAHGATSWAKQAIEEIKKKFKVEILAGNVATFEGAQYLANTGADAIKVGIGGGSICTTRIITGVGVPNITAIRQAKKALVNQGIPIVIDGGIRYSGDIVKAIAAGADCAMCGNLLAGTQESPGQVVTIQGRKYKRYRGMSVKQAMNKRTQDRYYLKKEQKTHVSQGVSGMVNYKGALKKVIELLEGGLRSGMENAGSANIQELKEKTGFYQVTGSGEKEAHAHELKMIEQEENYSKK